ncbi:hypothetical protein F4781DRAFT_430611 [Annulohypoxylon bovei var. microspora]|nr:hypothetical protein F4781DRAFT_430611 [Annulohypoxylon bovei var. microspora]
MASPLRDVNANGQKTNSSPSVASSTIQDIENSRNKTAEMTKPIAASSLKRKSDAVEDRHSIPDVDEGDLRLHRVDETCNQIRRKVRNFIEGGNMKVGEFQKTIGVSSGAYQQFMSQRGTYKGNECETYARASAFFKKCEMHGLQASPPKKAKKAKKGEGKKVLDVGDIELEGEDTQEVPVYDTCDEIRKKIRALLRKPDVSQAAFCQAISKGFPEGGRKVQSRQLNAFLGKKGSMSGNTSPVFYGTYVFLEKQRVKDGKAKSEMRREMENIHPNGVNTSEPEDRWICRGNERPFHDQYGRVRFIPG